MAAVTLLATSREYVYGHGLRAFDKASPDAATDVTLLDVFFAFLSPPSKDPQETDWIPGEWSSDGRTRILIGPGGGHVLAKGIWNVCVRVVGGIEQPEGYCGTVQVT